ncbi:MAG: glucose-6-phosphate 1-dehydrogenase [Patescibacteria group bacterium]|nr:glucose-6-phosphate 1-dehydrogenase [Patescibacteria group bacterium]
MIKELVLFGVTGDLAKQKLIPALFNLHRTGKISRKSSFVGFGRKKFTKVDFQNFIEEVVTKYKEASEERDISASAIRDYVSQWTYIESELDDVSGYKKLESVLNNETVIYLSIPPIHQYTVVQMLTSSGVLSKSNQRKIAIEKPFGFDFDSSERLENLLNRKLKKDQILRVDHYAGKQALVELEQVARQGIFRDMLSVKNFKKIEVNFVESKDVSMRGSFYDGVGALNDIGQNHMLHMLATILAIPELGVDHKIVEQKKTTKNSNLKADNLSTLRAESLSLISVKTGNNSPVLAQYEGFASTAGVRPDSITETFFKAHTEMKKGKHPLSKRWGGLQVLLVGGKALAESDSSIVLYPSNKKAEPIQILVNGYGKKDAYEQIFLDAFYYDADRFVSFNQIQKGWEIVKKIKSASKKSVKRKSGKNVLTYKKGSYPQDISYKS